MNTFIHSGATGDMVFSLPTIRAMGGGKLIISNFDKQRSESIKKLIAVQPYITSVEIADGNFEGYDLNRFRDHAGHFVNLVEAHFKGQRVEVDTEWKKGWLTLPSKINRQEKYAIINRTTNYEDWKFNWANEVEYLKTIADKIYFIGYKDEYHLFNQTFGTDISYIECDFLEGAYLIQDAVMFTGCYSAWSTVAMGLGGEYRLVQAPGHTCSSLFEPRETIINI